MKPKVRVWDYQSAQPQSHSTFISINSSLIQCENYPKRYCAFYFSHSSFQKLNCTIIIGKCFCFHHFKFRGHILSLHCFNSLVINWCCWSANLWHAWVYVFHNEKILALKDIYCHKEVIMTQGMFNQCSLTWS